MTDAERHEVEALNVIAGLEPHARALMRELCRAEGRHIPSVSAFMTTDPIHVCLRCGDEFSRSTKGLIDRAV